MAVSWPVPVGPVIVFDIATAPAKPLVAAGLPRLVSVSETPAVFPEVKVTLVELVTMLNPLTLTVWPPVLGEFLATSPVAACVILTEASPVLGAEVTLIPFVTIAPPTSVTGAGRTKLVAVKPDVAPAPTVTL